MDTQVQPVVLEVADSQRSLLDRVGTLVPRAVAGARTLVERLRDGHYLARVGSLPTIGRLSGIGLALLTASTAHAAPSAREKQIVAAVDRRADAALELLAETVNVPSATENLAGVRAVGDIYAREFRALGFDTRWVEVPADMKRAGHFVATHRGKRGGPRLLLIGHLDTVLQGEPFRRDGNRAYGTG